MTNCRLPAEWAPQSGLMLTWPHAGTDWGAALEEVEPAFVAIARETSRFQAVLVSCHDANEVSRVRAILQRAKIDPAHCKLYSAPSNDCWVRDHGPITLIENGTPVLLDFTFNGWGGKYPAEQDNRINRTLLDAGAFNECPMRTLDFVLEGGSLETDGHGTILTTKSCLLAPNRNSGYSLEQIEDYLKQHLCADRILWLTHGHLQGDDTDGHVDTLVRFADTETLLYVATTDRDHPDFDELQKMQEELRCLHQVNGKPYRLVPLPCPLVEENGEVLPASYANYTVINNAVLVPQYNVKEDSEALGSFRKCFPDRTIIGIDCRPLIRQYGSLHCVTMNLPEGVIK